MPTLTQLTGGTCPMKIGDTEFKANPLTDLDYAELDEYVQDHVIQIAKRNAKGADRQDMLQAALKATAGLRWNSEEGAKVITSKIGTFRIGYQMVKRNHQISFDDFVVIANKKPDDSVETIDLIFTKLNINQEPEKNA